MKNSRNTFVSLLFVIFLVGVVFALSGSAAQADDPPLTKPSRRILLIHDPTYNPHRVPPPPPRDPNEIGAQAVSFDIVFDDGAGCGAGTFSAWPAEAKTAFQYAANQWSALLNGTVAIDVHACWQSDLPFGVLGGASHDWIHSTSFNNEPYADSWYPTALADQLHGSNTNGAFYDIDATFSSTFSWYYGTDGNPGFTQVDFASVVMHEIGHGLGFDGVMNYGIFPFNCGGANYGCWGQGTGSPGVYDRFTENGSNQQLISAFLNFSAALGSQLTSDNLYFDGTNARAANGGTPARIYAPGTWSSGSSYAHLDEIYNPTPHALMTYSLNNGESAHHPGSVTLGIFQDIGWSLAAPPSAPSGLSAAAISQTQINLSWTDNSSDEAGFKIERSLNGTSGWTQIGTVGANVTTYNDSNGLGCDTTYYYRVRAYNGNGDSGYSNTANATTNLCPGPTAPSALSAATVSATQIDLSWTDNSGDETGFKIERSLNGTSGWTQPGTVGANVTTYSDSGLTTGTTYYYRVRAYNGAGDSAYSNISSAIAGYRIFLPVILYNWP